jgi:inhibitor of cysteine peptidase
MHFFNFIVLIILFFTFSCSIYSSGDIAVTKDNKTQKTMPDIILTENDINKTIDLQRGQALNIRLDANHTTGFRWLLSGFVSECVEINGEPQYEIPRHDPGFVGAGGVEIWHFTGIKKGLQTIIFEYRRPWEKEVAPEKRVSFIINVI